MKESACPELSPTLYVILNVQFLRYLEESMLTLVASHSTHILVEMGQLHEMLVAWNRMDWTVVPRLG